MDKKDLIVFRIIGRKTSNTFCCWVPTCIADKGDLVVMKSGRIAQVIHRMYDPDSDSVEVATNAYPLADVASVHRKTWEATE